MNLQTIQKRVEELSAELLTLSNDLSHLIQGEVVRQPALPHFVTHWGQLRANDRIEVSRQFKDCVGQSREPGVYTVAEVEPRSYSGDFQVALRSGGGGIYWLRFDQIKNCVVVGQ